MVRTFWPVFAGVMVWSSLIWGQRPTEAEAAAIVASGRQQAMAYARSLPDFVCTEIIHRYSENRQPGQRAMGRTGGTPLVSFPGKWTPADKLTVRLSYFQKQEEHKLVLVSDKPTDQSYESLAGGTGTGEFGGTLVNIFVAESETSFRWESWKTVRKHRVAVYSYSLDAAHSRYAVVNAAPGDTHQAVVGLHGKVEIDRDTGEVLHLTYVATDIPKEVHMDEVSNAVEYDFADVGGRDYLLPAHSETIIRSPLLSVLNTIDFREYRKFSTDSTIEFGVGK